jgi:hypothetical protein
MVSGTGRFDEGWSRIYEVGSNPLADIPQSWRQAGPQHAELVMLNSACLLGGSHLAAAVALHFGNHQHVRTLDLALEAVPTSSASCEGPEALAILD